MGDGAGGIMKLLHGGCRLSFFFLLFFNFFFSVTGNKNALFLLVVRLREMKNKKGTMNGNGRRMCVTNASNSQEVSFA